MPVVPATQEAEAGELPEPRRWRLRWAKIMPLHFSLGNNSETPSQKKKKRMQGLFNIEKSVNVLFKINILKEKIYDHLNRCQENIFKIKNPFTIF